MFCGRMLQFDEIRFSFHDGRSGFSQISLNRRPTDIVTMLIVSSTFLGYNKSNNTPPETIDEITDLFLYVLHVCNFIHHCISA